MQEYPPTEYEVALATTTAPEPGPSVLQLLQDLEGATTLAERAELVEVFIADTGQRRSARDLDAVLQRLIIHVIEGGHRDGIAVRAAALGCLVGVYANAREAAKRLQVADSTLSRAISAMREEVFTQSPKPL